MHTKNDFKKLKTLINSSYPQKAYGRIYFPLVVENKKEPWFISSFAHLKLEINNQIRLIPNIEICSKFFHKTYCEYTAMLAHEFGHFISYQNGESTSERLNNKCHKGKPLSEKERRLILDEELRAWGYGFEFLEDNDFDICPEMREYKKYCMASYYSNTKKLINLK